MEKTCYFIKFCVHSKLMFMHTCFDNNLSHKRKLINNFYFFKMKKYIVTNTFLIILLFYNRGIYKLSYIVLINSSLKP